MRFVVTRYTRALTTFHFYLFTVFVNGLENSTKNKLKVYEYIIFEVENYIINYISQAWEKIYSIFNVNVFNLCTIFMWLGRYLRYIL